MAHQLGKPALPFGELRLITFFIELLGEVERRQHIQTIAFQRHWRCDQEILIARVGKLVCQSVEDRTADRQRSIRSSGSFHHDPRAARRQGGAFGGGMTFYNRAAITLGLITAMVTALPASSETATYTYDARGRLATASYSTGATVTYSYDAAGNRTQVVVTGGNPTAPDAVNDSLSVAGQHRRQFQSADQ